MRKYDGPVPQLDWCIRRLEEDGVWKLAIRRGKAKLITGDMCNWPWYIFRNQRGNEVAFTLPELRHAAVFGW